MSTQLRSGGGFPKNAHGSFDAPQNGKLNGWAFDPDDTSVRVIVDIRIDGEPFCKMEAGEFRADLLHVGIGDGSHAFSTDIPERFFDGKPHKVDVSIAETAAAVQHSPRTVVFPRPPAAPGTNQQVNTAAAEANNPQTLPDSLLHGLSVVIATKDNGMQLERMLLACAPAARNLPVEFIVIVYGDSANDSLDRLQKLSASLPELRWKAVSAASPGEARNAGVALATRELILFLADSVTPAVPLLFQQHIEAHRMLPNKNVAVLGKVVWPNLPDDRVSFLMAHVQGAGGQQFGFHSLLPYTWLDWRFFSPDNISFKRAVAADWSVDGYRPALPASLLEDAELAFRLDSHLERGLQILYCPAASVSHENVSTVRHFIERQVAFGRSARALFEHHEGAKEKLGIVRLEALLNSPVTRGTGTSDDLLRMIEGAKSWGVVIESHYRLGSQNWHADLLNAIFELSYLQGYVMGCPNRDANYAAAYRYCMERFQEKLSTAAAFEVFGRFPGATLT